MSLARTPVVGIGPATFFLNEATRGLTVNPGSMPVGAISRFGRYNKIPALHSRLVNPGVAIATANVIKGLQIPRKARRLAELSRLVTPPTAGPPSVPLPFQTKAVQAPRKTRRLAELSRQVIPPVAGPPLGTQPQVSKPPVQAPRKTRRLIDASRIPGLAVPGAAQVPLPTQTKAVQAPRKTRRLADLSRIVFSTVSTAGIPPPPIFRAVQKPPVKPKRLLDARLIVPPTPGPAVGTRPQTSKPPLQTPRLKRSPAQVILPPVSAPSLGAAQRPIRRATPQPLPKQQKVRFTGPLQAFIFGAVTTFGERWAPIAKSRSRIQSAGAGTTGVKPPAAVQGVKRVLIKPVRAQLVVAQITPSSAVVQGITRTFPIRVRALKSQQVVAPAGAGAGITALVSKAVQKPRVKPVPPKALAASTAVPTLPTPSQIVSGVPRKLIAKALSRTVIPTPTFFRKRPAFAQSAKQPLIKKAQSRIVVGQVKFVPPTPTRPQPIMSAVQPGGPHGAPSALAVNIPSGATMTAGRSTIATPVPSSQSQRVT